MLRISKRSSVVRCFPLPSCFSYLILSHPTLSPSTLSYLSLLCPIISYHILSTRLLSYLILPYAISSSPLLCRSLLFYHVLSAAGNGRCDNMLLPTSHDNTLIVDRLAEHPHKMKKAAVAGMVDGRLKYESVFIMDRGE